MLLLYLQNKISSTVTRLNLQTVHLQEKPNGHPASICPFFEFAVNMTQTRA